MIIIPEKITLAQAQDMRTVAEKGTDPSLYEMAASAFDALEMPAAAAACRSRAKHYKIDKRLP